MRSIEVGAVILVAGVAACGPPAGTTDLRLGWTFADGRRCADAAAATIAVSAGPLRLGLACPAPDAGDPAPYACTDGEQGATVQLSCVPLSTTRLTLEARTFPGTAIYQGDLPLSWPFPATATGILYFR